MSLTDLNQEIPDYMKGSSNTDKEIWRKNPEDNYSPRILVTEGGGVGITVGGYTIVKRVEDWHKIASKEEEVENLKSWFLACQHECECLLEKLKRVNKTDK